MGIKLSKCVFHSSPDNEAGKGYQLAETLFLDDS